MRNKRVLFFALAFLLMTMNVWAQSPVFDHPLSAQNLDNFDTVCAKLASRPYTKGVFEQTKMARRQSHPLVSGGDFIIVAELGMVWINKYPTHSVTALTREYMIQSVPGGAKVKIDAKGNEVYHHMADAISSMFTGNAEKLKANFDNYYMEGPAQSGTVWTIGLIPKEKTFRNYVSHIVIEGFTDIMAAVTTQTITIYERGGGSTAYAFSEQIYPQVLEAHEKAYFSAD